MYSSYSVKVAVCSVVSPTLAIAAVGLRFYSRRTLHLQIKLDDYLIFFALICAVALCIIFLNASINASLGQDLMTITPQQYVRFNKHIYAGVIAAYLAFGTVKLSVLQYYKRIFDARFFCRILNGLLCVVGLWVLVTLFLAIFSAMPISNFWKLGADYAFNHPQFLFYSTILDTTFDLIILCLPFPMIWRLPSLDFKQKIQVTFVFLTGFFCVTAAGLRIYFGWRLSGTGMSTANQVSNDEFSYIVFSNVIWCEVEACCSVIAACLVCLGPFLRRIFRTAVNLYNAIRSQPRCRTSGPGDDSSQHSMGETYNSEGKTKDHLSTVKKSCNDSIYLPESEAGRNRSVSSPTQGDTFTSHKPLLPRPSIDIV